MSELGLFYAFLLDGNGGAKNLTEKEARLWKPEGGVLWLHFNYEASKANQWIKNDPELQGQSKEFLLSLETLQQAKTIGETLILALRAINLNPEYEPEDMVGLRILADRHKIITTTRRNVVSLESIAKSFENGQGPKNTSEFIVDLTSRLMKKMNRAIHKIDERMDKLEVESLENTGPEILQQLSHIKHTSIALRKHLTPQRKAMVNLNKLKPSWLQETDRQHLRHNTDHLKEYIEELVSISDRAFNCHEALAKKISCQMKIKLRALSILTAILLPLCIVSVLMVVIVGGISWADHKGIVVLLAFFLALVTFLVLFLKKKKCF